MENDIRQLIDKFYEHSTKLHEISSFTGSDHIKAMEAIFQQITDITNKKSP